MAAAVSVLDVVAADGDVWFVSSQSEPGVWRKVHRIGLGLFGCSCPWGLKAAERLNTRPCAHLRAVAGFVASLTHQEP